MKPTKKEDSDYEDSSGSDVKKVTNKGGKDSSLVKGGQIAALLGKATDSDDFSEVSSDHSSEKRREKQKNEEYDRRIKQVKESPPELTKKVTLSPTRPVIAKTSAKAMQGCLWKGYYKYEGKTEQIDMAWNISKLTDKTIAGQGLDDQGDYTIAGTVDGINIEFVKKYSEQQVAYSGQVSADKTRIWGHWDLNNGQTLGSFKIEKVKEANAPVANKAKPNIPVEDEISSDISEVSDSDDGKAKNPKGKIAQMLGKDDGSDAFSGISSDHSSEKRREKQKNEEFERKMKLRSLEPEQPIIVKTEIIKVEQPPI